MNLDLATLVRRLETAQALQSRAFLLRSMEENSGVARAWRGKWGFAHWFGEGHFLNQALGLGLSGEVTAGRLDRIEALLGAGGHPVVVELAPTAHPALAGLLAKRGYEIRAFQQVLMRELKAPLDISPDGRVEMGCAEGEEVALWQRVVQAGFEDRDDLEGSEAVAMGFPAGAEGNRFLLARVEGQPAAAAVLGCFGRVAVLSGTSVLPRFRGLGLQRRLVAERLRVGSEAGCRRACAAVLPGTASQANLERCGFRVAYPKLELARTFEM